MAQRLRVALLFSLRSQVQLSAPILRLTITRNSSTRESKALFWSLEAPGTHIVHIYTYRQTLIQIKIESKSLKQ